MWIVVYREPSRNDQKSPQSVVMICTLYSFKEGVRRSMALANLAEELRARGLRVVAVDCDLEPLGLEMYFRTRPAAKGVPATTPYLVLNPIRADGAR